MSVLSNVVFYQLKMIHMYMKHVKPFTVSDIVGIPYIQVISSLKRALQPAVTDLSIKFDVPSSFKVYQAPEEVPTLFSGDKVVVYGIIKKRKSASDELLKTCVNGTATLTGQILSKPIQFKLTFEIPPPPDFQSSVEMPIVHQLASKSLIHDLESGESWTYKQ